MKQNRNTLILAAVFAALVLVYFLAVHKKTSGTMDESASVFAVKDTARIARIKLAKFMKNKAEEEIVLERSANRSWVLNGKFPPNLDRVKNLTDCLYLVEVKEALGEAAKPNAHKLLAERHFRVEVEMENGDEKVFFVGPPTSNSKGTIMLMDRSSDPYITEIPGFEGYLTTRFETKLDGWRENLLFDSSPLKAAEVSVVYPAGGDSSFLLLREQNNRWRLATNEPVDSFFVAKYLDNIKRTYGAAFADDDFPGKLKELQAKPANAIFSVKNTDGTQVRLFLVDQDQNTYFAWIEGKNELLLVQKFVINRVLAKRNLFFPLDMKLRLPTKTAGKP